MQWCTDDGHKHLFLHMSSCWVSLISSYSYTYRMHSLKFVPQYSEALNLFPIESHLLNIY